MDFQHSQRTRELLARLDGFIEREVAPVEEPYHRELLALADPWVELPVIADLKAKARAEGLWNLFLPDAEEGAGLSNVEYAPLAERMGRSLLAAEICNCNAPDSGNMEVLWHFGSDEQKRRWLRPLLDGEIRSAFCMTEPDVASSDATNMHATARLEGEEVVLNGRKWWSSGAGHPRCEVMIFMALTDPEADRYHQHSMVLVPRQTPGVKVERMLTTMGFVHAPGGHGEVSFTDVRLPRSAIIGGPGQAFAIAQARLGPGRIHHCMRLIGVAELALEKRCKRVKSRVAFGKPVAEQTVTLERIAEARIMIEQSRLLTLKAAYMMDKVGNKVARAEIAMIKVAAPNMLCKIVDWAIQAHGAGGVSDDFGLAKAYAGARTLRLADGPDEVHRNQIGRIELKKYN